MDGADRLEGAAGCGAIHSDLEHHFIRAETIRWDQLLEAGSEAAARAKGTLRLEGKSMWCRMGMWCTYGTAGEKAGTKGLGLRD